MVVRGDARQIPLAAGSVQCVVTSPPYWGLRDYGTGAWEGGNADCGHLPEPPRFDGPKQTGAKPSGHASKAERIGAAECWRCGARRIDRQIGLEPTPDEYVATMVGVFREVWRALRDDGVIWLNLGDSYFGDSPARKSSAEAFSATWNSADSRGNGGTRRSAARVNGLKPKDLCGMPWRVAFALQADGWYLRSDIIWAKPAPMPESVWDRPTRSHEYIFLLTKKPRYYYDCLAIREEASDASLKRISQPNFANQTGGPKDYRNGVNPSRSMRQTLENFAKDPGRNKRDVWTVNSEPTPEAHFATFPQKLIEPCILAGSRPGDICFDPFLGSGTVGRVCERLGRRWVGLELSEPYIEIAKDRTAQMGLGI